MEMMETAMAFVMKDVEINAGQSTFRGA